MTGKETKGKTQEVQSQLVERADLKSGFTWSENLLR